MATYKNKEIIAEMIESDGSYRGDPKPVAIYETYNSMSGCIEYVVCYVPADVTRMFQSEVITAIKKLWP